MKNAPMKRIADQLATHGRYGDTMLVHMNPREVAGIASLAPGGKLTINPVTGQPEAFLPFLAPLIGSWLGSAAAGAGMLGGLGTLAGSAIGSGLATTLATGDIEQGLISGITGFGLGSALQGLQGAAGATGAITEGTQTAAKDLVNQALSETPTGIAQGITPTGPQQIANALGQTGAAPQMSPVDVTAQTNPVANIVEKPNFQMSPIPEPSIQQGIVSLNTPPPKPTLTEGLMAPFREPGKFMTELTKPGAFLPMYVGEGTNAGIRAQQQMEEDARKIQAGKDEESSAARQGILRALQQVRTDYGMFAGGQVDYASGGEIDSDTQKATSFAENFAGKGGFYGAVADKFLAAKGANADDAAATAFVNDFYGQYGGPAGLQSSLRGSVLNTPPAFDYSALYSGGSGYAPGIAPEFLFFGNRAPTPPGGGGGTGGGGTGGGGVTPPGGGGGGSLGGDFSFVRDIPMGGYINTPTSDPFDIQYLLDRYSPTEDEYWRTELAKMPPRMFAEGGEVEPTMAGLDMVEQEQAPVNPARAEYDNLVQQTIAAIKGQVENPEAIIQQFVAEYGNEMFLKLREQVLQGVQPGAQTQGLVDGAGGGMDDMVQGSIADGRPVAVSPGEYIVPADVVSAAGDGHTNSGAKFFDDLIESIRVNKNGTSEQPKPMKDIMG
jgi:hypothetical protein